MNAPIDLICLFWTTAGIFPGDGEISPYDFKDRVESASRAGFKGVGLWHTDLEHCLIHRSLKEMKAILDDNGMQYLELEFLTDWFLEGGRKAESDQRKRRLLEAAAVLGATHIKIGDFYNLPYSMPRVVEAFAGLCEEARQVGTRIGFEVMGCSMIDNLPDALKMVEAAGAKNGRIILDILQIANLGISLEAIRSIPLKHLLNFELNDGALPDSPLYDPTRVRRFCGEGDFDIQGLIRTADEMGFRGPWSVEVMSPELVQIPLQELANRAYQTTVAAFEKT